MKERPYLKIIGAGEQGPLWGLHIGSACLKESPSRSYLRQWRKELSQRTIKIGEEKP